MLIVRYVHLTLTACRVLVAELGRAAKRFKYQEEGRGVVRRWAEWAVDEASHD